MLILENKEWMTMGNLCMYNKDQMDSQEWDLLVNQWFKKLMKRENLLMNLESYLNKN